MNNQLTHFLKHLPPNMLTKIGLLPVLMMLRREAKSKGFGVRIRPDFIDISRDTDVVRISTRHLAYFRDIINSFEYYFGAVVPIKFYGKNIVDYSTPRYHDVVGFDSYPILFPSFSEPLVTTTQYVGFANLSEGMVVLDLGAYSGLTSIVFSQIVGKTGTVVAVDADFENIACIKRNFQNYSKYSDNKVLLLEGAVWENNDGIEFSCEGNMGASAASIVGNWRGSIAKVPSYTLSSIAEYFDLQRVDFIKCDIEGAENVIFTDREFFQRFSPRIIVEPHTVDGVETTGKCMADLAAYGYKCKKIAQNGVFIPLLECYPPNPIINN